jgi:hypothetical protein
MTFSNKAAGKVLGDLARFRAERNVVGAENVNPPALAAPTIFAPTSAVIPQMFAGTGANDAAQNAARFQAALDYLHALGGGRLRIPYRDGGVYALGAQLQCGGNISIECDPGVRLLRSHNGGFLRNSLGVTSATAAFSGNGKIVIDGGIWDGNGRNFYNGFNHIAIGHMESLHVYRADFLDNIRAHAFDLSASRDAYFDECRFMGFAHLRVSPDGYGTSGDGLGDDRTFSEAIQLDHNVPGSFSFGAIDRTQPLRTTVRGCYVGPNDEHPADDTFGSWGAGIGAHGSVHNRFATDTKVIGNTFVGCVFAGVRSWKWDGLHVIGNTFRSCARGVHDTPVAFNFVSAEDETGTPSGVGSSGRTYIVSENNFVGGTDIDIFFSSPSLGTGEPLHYKEGVTISGNNHRNANRAVVARALRGATLTGNNVFGAFRAFEFGAIDGLSMSGGCAMNIDREAVFQSEGDLPSALRNTSLSKGLRIHGLVAQNIGYSGINLSGAVKGFSITGCDITGPSQDTAIRSGILISTNCANGYIAGNRISRGPYALQHVSGINVTATCANIDIGQNSLRDHSGDPVVNLATGTSGLVP